MSINPTEAANNFNTFSNIMRDSSLQSNKHLYLSLKKDNTGKLICVSTVNKNSRASLKAINQFANNLFQQMKFEAGNATDLQNLQSITKGLGEIHDQISTKRKSHTFFQRIWFWVKGGEGILASTKLLTDKMNKILGEINPAILKVETNKPEDRDVTDKKSSQVQDSDAGILPVPKVETNKSEDGDVTGKKQIVQEQDSTSSTLQPEKKDDLSEKLESLDDLLNQVKIFKNNGENEKVSECYLKAYNWCKMNGQPEEAFNYLKEAHELGNPLATSLVAKCCEEGSLRQEKDLIAASRGYYFAARKYFEVNQFENAVNECKNVLRCTTEENTNEFVKVMELMARNSNIDLVDFINQADFGQLSGEKRAKLYFVAGLEFLNLTLKENVQLFGAKMVERLNESGVKFISLSASNGNLKASIWLAEKKIKNEERALEILGVAKKYELKNKNKKAFTYYEKSANLGNLEALNILIECFTTGRLEQAVNSKKAGEYHLKIAEHFFKSQNQQEYINKCREAFKYTPNEAILFAAKKGCDVNELFSNEAEFKLIKKHDVAVNVYLDNARSLLNKNKKQALEQCKYALHFKSREAAVFLVEHFPDEKDLFEAAIPDQVMRRNFYFETANECRDLEQKAKEHMKESTLLLFKKAASEGHVVAMLACVQLGTNADKSLWSYRAGEAFENEENAGLAVKYYNEAATIHKNVDAHLKLADCYQKGLLGLTKDPIKAAEHFCEAGSIYSTRKMEDKALEQWNLSVKLGSSKAAKEIYSKYRSLNSVSNDPKVRADLFLKLGKEEKDDREQIIYFNKAAEENSPEAMLILGKAYLWNPEGEYKFNLNQSDKKDPLEFLLKAAKRYEELNENELAFDTYFYTSKKFPISVEALVGSAKYYKTGKANPNEAALISHYQAAAKSDNLAAHLELANCYQNGLMGTNQDSKKAAEHLYKAGLIYEMKKNEDKAFEQWILSAKLGSIDAVKKIFNKYNNLELVSDDSKVRADLLFNLGKEELYVRNKLIYFKKAVEEKSADAMFYLGMAHVWPSIREFDLQLKDSAETALNLLLNAAKRYEELNQNNRAIETYTFITKKYSSCVEAAERLAKCNEKLIAK